MSRLKIYGIAILPPGIPLKHPILVASTTIEDAAKSLKVSRHHLIRHNIKVFPMEDVLRALACPYERIVASEVTR